MTFLILGATKGIGYETAKRAVDQGHKVRGLSRSADEIGLGHPNFEPFPGDALDADDVMRACEGVSAVIMALGVPFSKSLPNSGTTLFSDATRVLIPAMQSAGVDRLLVVTGFGAGDSRDAMSSLEKLGHRMILGGAYADKDRQEALVRATLLRWTLVRPVILTDGGATGRYQVLDDPTTWRNGMISRSDVADYLVRAAAEDLNVGQPVVLAR